MHQMFIVLFLIPFCLPYNKAETAPFNTTAYAIEHQCIWLPCNVTDFPSTYNGYEIDCCALKLPLNYAHPNKKISISMTRFTPKKSTAKFNTLFVLNGGPGGSSWEIFYKVTSVIPSSMGITLILPDHRGTGLSSLLSCDEQGSQNLDSSCISYLLSTWGKDGLDQFSITSAAHDLAVQIQSYQINRSGRISIYAVSYGSLWLDRFLQIYPTIVEAAVMDGVVNPIGQSISRSDLWASSISWQFLNYCQLQPECNAYFPVAQPAPIMLHQILQELQLDEQLCIRLFLDEYQLTTNKLRTLLFSLIRRGERYMDRTVIPALIYRLNRCTSDDVTVLKYFFNVTLSYLSEEYSGLIFSDVLSYHITQSEMWLAANETEIDEKTYNSWLDSTIMASERPSNYFSLRAEWPKYPLDQYYGRYASNVSVLMLSGQLDPAATFPDASYLASLTEKTRKFYEIPLAGHVTIEILAAGYSCPADIAMSWLFPDLFPAEFGDPRCIKDLPRTIDFVGATELGQQYSLKFLNTKKPFEDYLASGFETFEFFLWFKCFIMLRVLLFYV